MKFIKLLLIACLSQAILSAEELKVTTLSTQKVDYSNGEPFGTFFRILCINGYQWLQYNAGNGSISQMFIIDNDNQTKPIVCPN